MTEIVIEAGRINRYYWSDVWRYRELFRVLAWRDLAVRYRQTVMGAAWALLRPFITMVVFTVIFSKLARLPSEAAAPYALMVFVGLLPWTLFSAALADASNSLIRDSSLIGKIYFPRLIVPLAAIGVALVDFLISFVMLLAMLGWYQFLPSWRIITFPFFLLIALVASVGCGLLFATLNMKFRDFRYVIPFALQFGLFVSPVAFSSALVPDGWRIIYSLNPVVGIIDGFRWCILGSTLNLGGFAISLAANIALLVLGVRYFRATERSFADLI